MTRRARTLPNAAASAKRPRSRPPGGPRRDAITLERIRHRIRELLAQGTTTANVCRRLQVELGVPPRTGREHVAAELRELAQATPEERAQVCAAMFARLRGLSRAAERGRKFAAAVAAERCICELFALFDHDQRLQVSFANATTADHDPEQVRIRLRSAMQALQRCGGDLDAECPGLETPAIGTAVGHAARDRDSEFPN